MRVEFPYIFVLLIGVELVVARPQPVDLSAQIGQACGPSNSPGIWKMQGHCPSGLEDWMTKGGHDRCQAHSGGGSPVVSSNGDLSFNPSNTPGRCVARTALHSDTSGGVGAGYYNPAVTDQLQASKQAIQTTTDQGTPEGGQILPGDNYGETTVQAAATEELDGLGINFDDYE